MILRRTKQNDFATYGELRDDEDAPLYVTLELPWRGNAHNVSCIPAGTYDVVLAWSPKHQRDLYHISNVPGRGEIELHVGNLPKDTDGCVLIGKAFGPVEDTTDHQTKPGIVGSQVAFDQFMLMMAGTKAFPLEVWDVAPVVA